MPAITLMTVLDNGYRYSYYVFCVFCILFWSSHVAGPNLKYTIVFGFVDYVSGYVGNYDY